MSQQDTTEVPFLNVLTIKKKNFAAARPKIGLHENQKKVKIKLVRLWNYSKIKKQGLTMWLYWRRKKRKKIIQKDKENSNDETFLFEKWGF